MSCLLPAVKWRWPRLAEVETYVDVAIMYAVIICLALLSFAILIPELMPA